MTMLSLNAVGFCAHYSEQGNWAFDYALRLSEMHGIQLNVFHFLADPYDPDDHPPTELATPELERWVIERERTLRMHYDERAGDYLEVGFRLCDDNEWRELHRCLADQEFQVLVLGYPGADARFAGKPMEEFADSFVCPVVLVGPDHPDQYYLNPGAALIQEKLGIPHGQERKVALAAG
jgi:hypothetical protein